MPKRAIIIVSRNAAKISALAILCISNAQTADVPVITAGDDDLREAPTCRRATSVLARFSSQTSTVELQGVTVRHSYEFVRTAKRVMPTIAGLSATDFISFSRGNPDL
jgi:hypothetical protein